MKDYFGYKGKVCVVTGAASGMGKAATEMLVDLGALVYALDCNEVEVPGITKFIKVDLGSKESIDAAFKEIPAKIDSFFGIAGVSGIKTDFNTTVTIDFIANKYMCEEYLINRMESGAAIAFITSTGGNNWEKEANRREYMPLINANGWDNLVSTLSSLNLNHLPGPLGYMFAKMAMNYYTAYLQKIFASKHVRVNALLPGSTETGMKDEFSMAAGGDDNLLKATGFAGRLATSKEMGEPVVFLNSDMASFISGELLIVDYGCSIMSFAKLQEDPMGAVTFDIIKNNFNKQ